MSKIALTPNASGSGTFTIAAPNSNTDRTLALPDEAGTVLTSATTLSPSTTNTSIVASTAQTLSGVSSITFTGIPSGVVRVTVVIRNLSTTTSNFPGIQIGTSGGLVTTGYAGAGGNNSAASNKTNYLMLQGSGWGGGAIMQGVGFLNKLDGNRWGWTWGGAQSESAQVLGAGGTVDIGGDLYQLSISQFDGASNFDDGRVNIHWEYGA
jgi:hypothetical protein